MVFSFEHTLDYVEVRDSHFAFFRYTEECDGDIKSELLFPDFIFRYFV
jgi:hypothetical protein